MIGAVADTHTIIWYLFDDPRLSSTARITIEKAAAAGEHVGCASITLAEMVYLVEKGRITLDALTRLTAALDAPGAVLTDVPFDRHIAQTMRQVARAEVPDLPDRIIAATALHLGVPLISRNSKIKAANLHTIW